jgi:hypothetical protein
MKEESAKVTTSLEYAHIGGLSVQLQGTHPKSINGLSPLALVKVVYPSGESEEVMMDLVTKQYYVSHGYTLKLTDIDIGTSYLPWKKMFTGTVNLTALSDDSMEEKLVVGDGGVQSTSVKPVDSNVDIKSEELNTSPVTMVSPTDVQTMQTSCFGNCSNYNRSSNVGINSVGIQRTDTTILAIVLGLISLGLLGLAFALVKRRD